MWRKVAADVKQENEERREGSVVFSPYNSRSGRIPASDPSRQGASSFVSGWRGRPRWMVKPCIQTLSFQLHSFTDFRGFVYTQLSGVFLPPRRSQKQGRVKPEPRQTRWPCALMTSSPVKKQRDLFIWQKQKESGPFIGDLTVPLELCGGGGGGQPTPPNASTGALGGV